MRRKLKNIDRKGVWQIQMLDFYFDQLNVIFNYICIEYFVMYYLSVIITLRKSQELQPCIIFTFRLIHKFAFLPSVKWESWCQKADSVHPDGVLVPLRWLYAQIEATAKGLLI